MTVEGGKDVAFLFFLGSDISADLDLANLDVSLFPAFFFPLDKIHDDCNRLDEQPAGGRRRRSRRRNGGVLLGVPGSSAFGEWSVEMIFLSRDSSDPDPDGDGNGDT